MSNIRIEPNGIAFSGYTIDKNTGYLVGPTPTKEDRAAHAIFSELATFSKAGTPGEAAFVQWINLASYASLEASDYARLYYDLGLPDIYDGPLYLESSGALATKEYTLKLRFPETISSFGAYGDRKLSRQGMLLQQKGKDYSYSCTPELFTLAEAIDNFNNTSTIGSTSREEVMRIFSQIKELAQKAKASCDKAIEGENIIQAGTITIDLVETGTPENPCVSLVPRLPIQDVEENAFGDKFIKRTSVDLVTSYTPPNGGRVRVTIDNNQAKALETIKSKYQDIKDSDTLIDLITNPPHEFDEANIDISSLYSDRVKGLGLYRPKIYPFICPFETEWIPGFIAEGIDGKTLIPIKTREEEQQIENAIEEATRTGKKYIDFNGTLIPIEDARKILGICKGKHNNPRSTPKEAADQHKVLLIAENVDELAYREKDSGDALVELTPSIPGLSPGFTLKPHQLSGVARIKALYEARYPGMIIADDMGLGKTVQALSFLELASHRQEGVLACIVSPKGLIGNWINEYRERFSEGSLIIKNLMADREVINLIKHDKSNFRDCVFVFSYQALRSNQLDLCAIDWDIAILDEAQQIKTPGTLVTNAAKALKARFKIAMTGTPVENTFHDLWCIADFAMPGFLGSAKEFSKRYSPSKDSTEEEIFAMGEELLERMGKRFLRRTKQTVLKDLPPKYESDNPDHDIHFSKTPAIRTMPPKQQHTYDEIIKQYKNTQAAEATVGKRGILNVLIDLKVACEHPNLVNASTFESCVGESLDSAKTLSLIEILSHIKERQEKAIIFAEFKKTQRLLNELIQEHFGIVPRILNGDTPPGFDSTAGETTRIGMIKSFNSGNIFDVIIMSPIAAGVGLTVTGANHVIHFSRHWNPSKEDQATDRAYRIGQNKPVYVYYLVARHPEQSVRSFDDNLALLLFSKRNLRGAVLYPDILREIKPEELLKESL